MHRIQVGGLAAAQVQTYVDALVLAREGHVSEALTLVDPLLDPPLDQPVDQPGAGGERHVLLLATASDCRLARGDLEDALTLGRQLAAYLPLPGRAGALAHHASGELAAALDDVAVAAAHFADAARLLPPGPDDARLVPWRVGAALCAVRLGRRAEAAALAREQHDLAAGSPSATALALRALAATEAGGGREGLLRRAAATLAPLRYGRLTAQVGTDLAGLLLLTGTPGAGRAEAVALLRTAEEHVGRHRLWPLQTRVRGLLERAGEPPRRSPHEVLATLTAAERRVSALAAQGLTNRGIAERLGVSVKSVEWHLSHVYRKLGIRSRAALAPTLGGADLVAPA